MKKHLNHYWLALALLLPALSACNDDNDTMPGEEPGTAGTPTVIRASIGSEPDTRAQVKWGTQNADEGEYFMWNANDQFKAYNITTAETAVTPTAYTFNIDGSYDEENPGNQADFSCANSFPAANGDKIAAFYGSIYGSVAFVADANGKKGIQAVLERVSAPQSQTATPGNADLKHLRDQLCMYAIGQAEGSRSVSPLSFRHLSALFRITIRNQKSDEAKIKYTGIVFPDNERIVCTKKTVTVWEDNTVEVTDNNKYSSTGNYLENAHGDNFATIAPGSSYDCFIADMPVAKEGNTASSITIGVIFADNTTQRVTIDGFTNVEIKPGMRYWFDLTVKPDGTLVQTFKTDYAWYASNKDATEYTLSTPGELRALANLVNGTEEAKAAAGVSGAVSFQGKTIRLDGNIDLGDEAWTPIGGSSNSFKGTFDGGGRHISRLNVDNGSANDAGLFGYVSGGTVRNLRVSGTVTTTEYNAGGIAGYLYGSTVENCIFDGDVSSGNGNVGGIAGYSYADSRIAGCHTKGKVTATATTSYDVGGIAGKNSGTIDGCYSEAEVKASGRAGGIAGSNENGTITHCYATGKVSGKKFVGGIVGYQYNSSVTGCIALNPGLTKTEGSSTSFGRIVSSNQGGSTVTSCGAYDGMTIKDASNTDIIGGATSVAGDDLTAADCLTTATYTSRGFTEANGWAFDTAGPWTYLPWNPAFASFPGISETDYRIAVPAHLSSGGTN